MSIPIWDRHRPRHCRCGPMVASSRSDCPSPSSKSAIKRAQCQTCLSIAEREQIMQYGLWQDYGTGRETPRGNIGNLGRAKKRQRRRWFSRKYYASVMNLREFLEENLGREFCGILSSALSKDFRQNHWKDYLIVFLLYVYLGRPRVSVACFFQRKIFSIREKLYLCELNQINTKSWKSDCHLLSSHYYYQ